MSIKPSDEFEIPSVAPTSHCDASSLTDSYGLAIQAVLAGLAFASLILKRLYCEPREQRRTWTIWFFDTSKQLVGAGVIHFLNVFLAQILHQKRGDPCTWYVVSFLLDSTLGLLIIYAGVRLISRLATWKNWSTLKFGEYGKPPRCRAWMHQCSVFVGIIILEKFFVTVTLEFRFWRHVREIILSPITNPKLEVTIVMLIIPFFMNTLIFWVVDNFTMRKNNHSRTINNNNLDDDSGNGSTLDGGVKSKKKTGGFNGGLLSGKKKKAVRTYVNEISGKDDDEHDSESGERLLQNDDDGIVESLETNSSVITTPKENDGLLTKRDSNVHLRLNSVSLL